MSKPKRYPMHHGTAVVEYAYLSGYAYFPDHLNPNPDELGVVIDKREKGKAKLDTLIHELMHLEHPDMSEDEVSRTATNIARVLWGEGYRNREDIK